MNRQQFKHLALTLVLAIFTANAFAVLGPINIYLNDDEASQTVDEIITIGTRNTERTKIESMVPIDILSDIDFSTQAPAADTNDILSNLLPSFNVTRTPIGDGSTFVRPASLRGLSNDHTLVLINGKRRHRSALIQLQTNALSGGSQGVDLSLIPSIAVKKVEVLKDGASAQYGSDAIAGVINFVLKDADKGGKLVQEYSQYSKGDGTTFKLGANFGSKIANDKGFVNVSLEYKNSAPTSRGTVRPDVIALMSDINCNAKCRDELPQLGDRPYPAQTWGDPESEDLLTFYNAELKIGERDLYLIGNYAKKKSNGSFYYRNPLTNTAVFGYSDHDDDKSTPPVRTPGIDGTDYDFQRVFPGGFVPRFFGETTDIGQIIGLRGSDNGIDWDISSSYGKNKLEYTLENTVNPSLGVNSPTKFTPGALEQQDFNFNADLSTELTLENIPLHIAGGFEYRKETYRIIEGDLNSYIDGLGSSRTPTHTAAGLGVGSNGFQGFSPDQAGEWSQKNTALYADVEADITQQLQLGIAARYEDFDTFGDTADGKLSGRFKVNDNFALRGSYSTGFRAPTPGQVFTTNLSTSSDANGALIATVTIPSDSPAAILLGGKALTPETSKNANIGFTWHQQKSSLSVDFYQVKVDDRIALSSYTNTFSASVKTALTAQGLINANSVRYFFNGIDTITEGVDITFTHKKLIDYGQLDFVAAFNHNKTTVNTQIGATLNASDKRALEKQTPINRLNLSARHSYGKYSLLARANWYDKWVEVPDNGAHENQQISAAWTLDLEGSYKVVKNADFVIGGKNIFDTYPDKTTIASDVSSGQIYPRHSPFGINGALWYARLSYDF